MSSDRFPMIYLDHASTTPVLPEVWEAMRPYAVEYFGNPASAHAAGRKARQALEDARERVASLLGALPDEVIFTSGATEANNLAIFGLAGSPPGHILANPVEHPCVTEPLRQLAGRGLAVEFLPIDRHGLVAVDTFLTRVRPDTRLAVMMLVNHETGVIQPVGRVSAASPGAFHTDAAQAVGKLPVSFRDLGVTTLSLSAHKFGGPKGAGALLLRHGTKLAPQLFGGHQQHGRRPGTEPVGLAVGLAAALATATSHMDAAAGAVSRKRKRFLASLERECHPVVVNGPPDGSPYILNVSFPGCRADLLLMKLDLAGVACSTGSACSSGSLLPSPVLQAMGVPDDILASAMRFSFGPSTTDEELDEAVRRIAACVHRLRAID
ncbi:MAG TPA: cysteine desulfurase family protein [Gemmataceae bacterium]|nr:cysteine desulfurase family protein [Gemmataceae bacterium]